MTDQTYTAGERRRSLGAVITSSFAVGLHFGILMPLVALVLARDGVGTLAIGLNTAMQPLAMLLLGPFIARIAGRLGTLASLYGGLAVTAGAILVMPFVPGLGLWFVLRFLAGVGMALPWLVGETWINTVAEDTSRGRVVAFYTTAFYGGLAAGPLVLQASGTEGWTPFLAAAGSLVLAGLAIHLYRGLAPAMPTRPRLGLRQAARLAPLVVAAALLAGFVEVGAYALLPLYALRSGLGQAEAIATLPVFTLGAIVLQAPLGLFADRLDRRRLLMACALGSILCAAVLPGAIGVPLLLWPLLVLWGGLALGFYTLGLALLGQRFPPADLAVANALFILAFEAGNVLGPASAGAAMDLWDPHGLLLALGLAAALFLAVAAALPDSGQDWRVREPLER
jgi:MFS family permease